MESALNLPMPKADLTPRRGERLPVKTPEKQQPRFLANIRRLAGGLKREAAAAQAEELPRQAMKTEDIGQRVRLAEEMANDRSRIISPDSHARVEEALDYLEKTGKTEAELTAEERSQLNVYLDIAALSFRSDVELHRLQPGVSAPGVAAVGNEVKLLGMRAALGDALQAQEVEMAVPISFSAEEQSRFSETERTAAAALVQHIHESTEKALYRVSKKGKLTQTEAGKRCEKAAVYDIVGNLQASIPHTFAQDRILDVVALAEAKLQPAQAAEPVNAAELARERQEIIDGTVHRVTLTRLTTEDADYRRWSKKLDAETIAQVRLAHEARRSGDAEQYEALSDSVKPLVDSFDAVYQKKRTGVMRRNIRGNQIKEVASSGIAGGESAKNQEAQLFSQAREQVGQVDARGRSLQQARLIEGIREEYGEIKDEERMVELKRMFQIKTGESNALKLHTMSKQRLAEEKRIYKALGLNEEQYSVTDRKRIVTRLYDSWQIIKDDVAEMMLSRWDGKGKPPVTFTAKGQLTESSSLVVFDAVKEQLFQALRESGIDIGSSTLADRIERKSGRLEKQLREELSQRIYRNCHEVRRLYGESMTKKTEEAFSARERAVAITYPQTAAERRASRPRLAEQVSKATRQAQASMAEFMHSNRALQAFSIAKGLTVLPAVAASGAHFAGAVIDGLNHDMIGHMTHDIQAATAEMDGLIQAQLERVGHDMASFGIETHPITETIQVVTETDIPHSEVVKIVRDRVLDTDMKDVPDSVLERCLTTRQVTLDKSGHTMQVVAYNPAAVKDSVCQTEFPGMKFALGEGKNPYEVTFPEDVHVPASLAPHITLHDFALNTEQGSTCSLTAISSIVNHFRAEHNQPGFQSWVFSELAQKHAPDGSIDVPSPFSLILSETAKAVNDPNASTDTKISSFNQYVVDQDGLMKHYGVTFDTIDFSPVWGRVTAADPVGTGAQRDAFIDANTADVARQVSEQFQKELDAGHIPTYTSYVGKDLGHMTVVMGTRHNDTTGQYELLVAEPNGGYTGWEYTQGHWQKAGDNGLVVVPLDAEALKHTYPTMPTFREAVPDDMRVVEEKTVTSVDHVTTVTTETRTIGQEVSMPVPFTDLSYRVQLPADNKVSFLDKLRYAWSHA